MWEASASALISVLTTAYTVHYSALQYYCDFSHSFYIQNALMAKNSHKAIGQIPNADISVSMGQWLPGEMFLIEILPDNTIISLLVDGSFC